MDHILSREDIAMHMGHGRMMMSQAQKYPIPSETDHLIQTRDGSLVDQRSLSMPVMPMSLGQMQLHQMPPSMLQSMGPPQLHPIGPQLHPSLHQLHPHHMAQLGSMVVVGPHSGHMVDHVASAMEASMEGSQPLEAMAAAAAAVSDETDSARKKQKAAKGSCKPPFNCAHCGKVYNKKYHLTRHERCHNNIKPYTCPQCPKAFVESGDLKKHVRVHTHDRPYKCASCPATFTQSSSLRVHERVHKGVRYTCDQCHHQFTRNYFLQQHKRRHVGGLDKDPDGSLSHGVVGVNVPHPHHVVPHTSDAEAAAVVVQAVQSVERVELAAAAAVAGVAPVPMVPSVPVPSQLKMCRLSLFLFGGLIVLAVMYGSL